MRLNHYCAALLITLTAATAIQATAEFKYIGSSAGFEASLVLPDDNYSPTFGWAGLMDFAFDMGKAGKLSFRPNLSFFISGWDDQGYLYGYGYGYNYGYTSYGVFQMGLDGDFRYYFPLPERIKVRPFVGSGLAIIWTYNSIHVYPNGIYYPYQNTTSTSDVGPGFDFQTGADFPFTPTISGFGEFKWTGASDGVSNARLTFGMNFLLGGGTGLSRR